MVTAASLLEDPAIHAYLRRILGEEGIELIEKFPEDGEYSDEDLAGMTGINLNTVRQSLYNLYERRLAEYRRIKNSETGWLTYLWSLRLDRIYSRIEEEMEFVLERLRECLCYMEENDFYICNSCSSIVTFDVASEAGFVCSRCGEPFDHFDTELLVTALRRRVSEIEDALGMG
ncbi:MAG: transcription factor [Methanoculleaceae archaeon]